MLFGTWTEGAWCLASSELARAGLGLLGPAAAIWFWQVWRAKSHTSKAGPQSNAARSRQYAQVGRWLVWPVAAFWIVTLTFYSIAHVALLGKDCDAQFTQPATHLWVALFVWSLVPLLVSFIALAAVHLQFRRYDSAARERE